jgi:hypothetical protein
VRRERCSGCLDVAVSIVHRENHDGMAVGSYVTDTLDNPSDKR